MEKPEKSGVKIGANQHISLLHRIDAMNSQKQQVAEALRELASKSNPKNGKADTNTNSISKAAEGQTALPVSPWSDWF